MFAVRSKALTSVGALWLRQCRTPPKRLTPLARYVHGDSLNDLQTEVLSAELHVQPIKFNALDTINEQNAEIINEIRPTLKKSFNLAAYINVSETLQQLLKLEVDLYRIDKFHSLASYIVRADFKEDIEPYILFLLDNGVDIAEVGTVINKNPFILTIPLEDLKVRINYFLFRKFSKKEVACFLVRAAKVFSLDTKTIDLRLAGLSKEYALVPRELRYVVNQYPRIIELERQQLKKCTFMFFEEMGFSAEEIRSILMQNPYLWRRYFKETGHADIVRVFDYMHNEIGFSHELIVKDSYILTCRLPLVQQRHQYLKRLDRLQIDPAKPLYVPLSAFYKVDDATFCEKYTKTSVNDYNAFLKTL